MATSGKDVTMTDPLPGPLDPADPDGPERDDPVRPLDPDVPAPPRLPI